MRNVEDRLERLENTRRPANVGGWVLGTDNTGAVVATNAATGETRIVDSGGGL